MLQTIFILILSNLAWTEAINEVQRFDQHARGRSLIASTVSDG